MITNFAQYLNRGSQFVCGKAANILCTSPDFYVLLQKPQKLCNNARLLREEAPSQIFRSSRNTTIVTRNSAVGMLRILSAHYKDFINFISREDIAIILINQHIAEIIRYTVDQHKASIPAVLEIPSKEMPYDPSKDSILNRARGMYNPEDF
ncbi:ATP synthase (F/14-kDa) subunit domain-containing protein [Ditylenchus destructor]|nr:ATP synthase (F/14-kDa) subunit domain-containing protein [Ditylenchus destructor]